MPALAVEGDDEALWGDLRCSYGCFYFQKAALFEESTDEPVNAAADFKIAPDVDQPAGLVPGHVYFLAVATRST